jgi:hypothetical protein
MIPAVIATRLFANRSDAPASAPVFLSVRQPKRPFAFAPDRCGFGSVG